MCNINETNEKQFSFFWFQMKPNIAMTYSDNKLHTLHYFSNFGALKLVALFPHRMLRIIFLALHVDKAKTVKWNITGHLF